MANPLLNDSWLPEFDKIEDAHIQPALQQVMQQCESILQSLEKADKTSFEDLLAGFTEIDRLLNNSWSVVNHLNSVKNSDSLREIYQECLPQIVQLGLKLGQNAPIYQKLKAIQQGVEWDQLDAPSKRIVSNKLKEMELAGVGLEPEAQKEFKKLSTDLSELSNKFSNNLLDAMKSYKWVLTEKADVAGLPDYLLDLMSSRYNQQAEAQGTKDAGPWQMSLEMPFVIPFMEYSSRRDLREKLLLDSSLKASSGEGNNQPVLNNILQLRTKLAKILGYETYADLSVSEKMAPSKDKVYALQQELLEASFKPASAELADLTKFAQSKGFDEPLKHWDIGYWARQQKEELFQFSEEELKPYFSLEKVNKGLFQLVKKLFNIEVKKRDDVAVWHSDVQFYEIFDVQTNQKVAAFYLDPFSRAGEKNQGAWMAECRVRHSHSGQEIIPIAYLNCNFTEPLGDTPSLLTFRDVETLFHEFGHGLQHMLTQMSHWPVSGINGVEWDAVELPSQFMENWCYHKETLLSLAKHYQTGETLPEVLFDKLFSSKNYRAASFMLRQIRFGLLDFHLHDDFDAFGKQDPFELQREIEKKTSVMEPLEGDRFLCSFSHIFAGGYAAGYYSYKWAEVLSADAFSAFEEVGLDNEAEVKKVGQRFKETVLALGGGLPPMDVFVAFRGRQPSTEPLLKHSGLL